MLSILLALILTVPVSLTASDTTADRPGLLLMAHGGSPEWNASVEEAVAPLRSRYPVAVAFGMADPRSLDAALDSLSAQGVSQVAVVRLFMDGRSFLHQTEYFLGLRDDPPGEFLLHDHGSHGAAADSGHDAHAASSHHGHHSAGGQAESEHAHHEAHAESSASETPPQLQHGLTLALSEEGLMDAEEVAAILASRAEALSQDPARESVLMLAHGTGDDVENARWVVAMEHLSGPVRARGFHSVRVETLREDWPDRRADAELRIRSFVEAETEAGRTVLVVPFRLSGFGPYHEVLNGLSYRASEEGLLPHDAITAWIDGQYRSIVAREAWTGEASTVIGASRTR